MDQNNLMTQEEIELNKKVMVARKQSD